VSPGRANRFRRTIGGAVVALALGSCEPTEIRVRTEFATDGSSTREIACVFPERQENGKGTGEAEVPDRLVLPAKEKWPQWRFEGTRLVARGFFPRAADVPGAYGWRGRREGRVLDSSVSFRRDDFVLFERYRYEERFRSPIDRDEMERSVSEAVDTAVALLVDALREILGDSFDLAKAEAWVRDEGARTLRALVTIWWEEMREEKGERLPKRIASRLARAGLEVAPEDLQGKDGWEKVLEGFARRIEPLLEPPKAVPAAARRPVPLPPGAVLHLLRKERFEEVLRSVAEKRFGSKEAAEKWFADRFDDLVGEFGGPNSNALRFDVTVGVPGEALRTNGVLLSPTEILWRFSSGDLFPDGIALEAESLALRHDRLGLLTKWKGSLDRRDVLDLIDLLADGGGAPKEKLVGALREGFTRPGTPSSLLEPLRTADEKAAAALDRVLTREIAY